MRASILAILSGCAVLEPTPADWSVRPVHSPPPGGITLDVGTMAPGHLARLVVDGAEPGETVFVLGSTAGPGVGPCPAAMAGACVDLAGDARIIATGRVGADGRAQLTRTIPAALSPSAWVGVQAVVLRHPGEAATSVAAEASLELPPLPGLTGQWMDAYGGVHTVTRRSWASFGSEHAFVESFADGDGGTLIARNDDANPYFPGLWSRFDWLVDPAGDAWFCQQAYAAASFDEALATPAADPSDPASGGCGAPPFEFGWTAIDPVELDVEGDYVDEWGTAHRIDAAEWSTDWGRWHVTETYAADGWLVAQNDAANDYFPDMWSRFDWAWSGDHLYYCQSEFAAVSEASAAAVPRPDDSDPAGRGCAGFPWTDLTP